MFVVVESQGLDSVQEMAFGHQQQISLYNTHARREALYRLLFLLSISIECRLNLYGELKDECHPS